MLFNIFSQSDFCFFLPFFFCFFFPPSFHLLFLVRPFPFFLLLLPCDLSLSLSLSLSLTHTFTHSQISLPPQHYAGLEEAVYRNIDACKQITQIVRTSFGPNGIFEAEILMLPKIGIVFKGFDNIQVRFQEKTC